MHARISKSVGIDLGTTFSSLAYLDPHGVPRIFVDGAGQSVVPSVVLFKDDEVVVGDVALEQAHIRPDNVVQFIKRHMGEPWRNEIHGQVFTPEGISAIILAHVVREAEPFVGPIESAVITVPAYFTERARAATQQAGEIAGLVVPGLLNEPMAAALAYGIDRDQREQTVLVYDLGGGTFDVTVVRIAPGVLEELATFGNRQLGGKDWDERLIEYVASEFRKEERLDPRDSKQAMQKLRLQCEQAKRRLSRLQSTTVVCEAFGFDHEVEITRKCFEELTIPLVQMTKLTAEMAIQELGLSWNQIDRVVLAGGSTHMPMIRNMLETLSGQPPDLGVNPVLAVALGAAIYAQILDGQTTDAQLLIKNAPGEHVHSPDEKSASPSQVPPSVRFVTAHGLGVRGLTPQGIPVNHVILPRNSRVPVSRARQFRTHQRVPKREPGRLKIVVTQGDTNDPDLAEVLGTLYIYDLPPGDEAGQTVDIRLTFDQQGRAQVDAVYVKTGQSLKQTLEVPGILKKEEVEHFRTVLEDNGLVRSARTHRRLDSIILEDDFELIPESD